MNRCKLTLALRRLLCVMLALCLCAGLCVPALADTEEEGNNSMKAANPVSTNTEVSGSISGPSDVDWYAFELPEDGFISLTFDHDFVDSSRSYWKTIFYTGENKELESWLWTGNATTAGTGNEIGVPAGTYYLCVAEDNFSAEAYRFTVNYTQSNTWEREFNETIVTANEIDTNTEISGTIRGRSDVDWYMFELPSDGSVSLTFDHDFVDNSRSCWKTAFYTSANQELTSRSWRGDATTAETGNETGVPAGIYYLRVSGEDFASETYRFTINYTQTDTWEKEFNETIVTANEIDTDTEISGTIRGHSDVDWYMFELPSDSSISLTFAHDFVDSSDSSWDTSFYTSANKEISCWRWEGNATVTGTTRAVGVSAGTYYLRITNDSLSSAAYRFTVNDLFSGWSGNEDPDLVAPSGVSLDQTRLSLEAGRSAALTATVTPSDTTNKTITWYSENTKVATVQNGRVTGVGEGTTTIIAACGEVSAFCAVTVKAGDNGKPQAQEKEVHFARVNVYVQDQFTDVPAGQWYTGSVAEAFELGLMRGNSQTTFNPYGDVTIADAVTMAARIHSTYMMDGEEFRPAGGAWYRVYLDYAYEKGIISQAYYNSDVTRKATRAQFATIFANSLPSEALAAVNVVDDGAIPDVDMRDNYSQHVYKLYRAGILAGGDANGTFSPTTYITRAEAAAVVSRMGESDNRVSITLR